MIKLPEVQGEYKLQYNLSHLTWLKVGGPAEIFFKPLDLADLSLFMRDNRSRFPVTIIGAGSNLIIRDGGIAGVVIKLGKNFTDIELTANSLKVGAGCLNFNLAKFCHANSVVGFEFLVGIPGTIGGGIAMNAGAYGTEFKHVVNAIEVIDPEGRIFTLTNSEIGFKYRGNDLPRSLIITRVIFEVKFGDSEAIGHLMTEIKTKRTATQPVNEKTGGSTFRNNYKAVSREKKIYKAWELIDQAGLRGFKIGNASMSDMHCNFMINNGKASAADLEGLGEFVRAKILANTGIDLEWEIKRIGKHG